MTAGDPMNTCPFCHQMYYVVNGHDCKYTPRMTFGSENNQPIAKIHLPFLFVCPSCGKQTHDTKELIVVTDGCFVECDYCYDVFQITIREPSQ